MERVEREGAVCVWAWVGGGEEEGGWGAKALLQSINFILGPDATLNTEIHKN